MHRRVYASIWWINTDRALADTNTRFPQWMHWVDAVLPTLIPVSSLTFAEKGGFRDCVGIFLIWQYLGIKVNVPTNHITAVSLLLPFQLLKDSCDTHIMLTQIRPELCFSHLYPESSFASSPICSAVRKEAHGAGEGWKERTPAVALAFRRGRSTDCKLWSAFLCIRCARYRAYSINMHSSWVINRRGLKRDGAVSGSGQLSVPLSVTGRERQTDTYSSTLRNSTAGYLLLLKCFSTSYFVLLQMERRPLCATRQTSCF